MCQSKNQIVVPFFREEQISEVITSEVQGCLNRILEKTIYSGRREPPKFHCIDEESRLEFLEAVISECNLQKAKINKSKLAKTLTVLGGQNQE